jgi:hypothetical protein
MTEMAIEVKWKDEMEILNFASKFPEDCDEISCNSKSKFSSKFCWLLKLVANIIQSSIDTSGYWSSSQTILAG